MTFLVDLIKKTFLDTFGFLGIIILIGLLLGTLRDNTILNFQRSFGRTAIMITGFIGVPIHELSHAIAAFLFAHRIDAIKLFQKPDEEGVMGYVSHSYHKNSIYQQVGNFFIGVAPIFGGTISMIVLMRIILPEAYHSFVILLEQSADYTVFNKAVILGILTSYVDLIKIIFHAGNLRNPYYYLFLFVLIAISSHISLSPADMKGAARGMGAVFILFFILNIFFTVNYLKYAILLTGFLMIAVIFSAAAFLISLLFR
jgi:hypothetical protein